MQACTAKKKKKKKKKGINSLILKGVRTYLRIVRDICYVYWLILWQNALYLQLDRSRMGLILQGTRVQV